MGDLHTTGCCNCPQHFELLSPIHIVHKHYRSDGLQRCRKREVQEDAQTLKARSTSPHKQRQTHPVGPLGSIDTQGRVQGCGRRLGAESFAKRQV